MPTALRQQAYPFGSLRKGPHWSVQGLVFYSQFSPAGVLFDESLFRNHGTIVGATWVGDGLYFDGDDDVVTVPSRPSISLPNKSVIVRFNREFEKANSQLARKAGGGGIDYLLRINDGPNEFRWIIETSTGTKVLAYSGINIQDGVWYTCAGTWDGITMRIYVDGALRDSSTPGGTTITGTADMLIGSSGTAEEFQGIISDVKIYNRALNASEIAALYLKRDLPMQQEPIWLFKAPAVVGFKPYWALNNNRLMGAM